MGGAVTTRSGLAGPSACVPCQGLFLVQPVPQLSRDSWESSRYSKGLKQTGDLSSFTSPWLYNLHMVFNVGELFVLSWLKITNHCLCP